MFFVFSSMNKNRYFQQFVTKYYNFYIMQVTKIYLGDCEIQKFIDRPKENPEYHNDFVWKI